MKYYKHIENHELRWGDVFVDPKQFVEIDITEFKEIKEKLDREQNGSPIEEEIKRLKENKGLISEYTSRSELIPAIECFGERIKNSIIYGEIKPESIIKFSKLDNIEDKVSVDTLNNIIEEHGNIDHAVDTTDNVNCYSFDLFGGVGNKHVYDTRQSIWRPRERKGTRRPSSH